MKAEQIFRAAVNMVCIAFVVLPLAAIIHHAHERAKADREFEAQQQEYYRVMRKKIKEYNETVERARKK